MPVTATRAAPLPVDAAAYPGGADVVGWQPVLSALADGDAAVGRRAGRHPLRRLRAGGELRPFAERARPGARPAFGWAAQYAVATKGQATFSLSQFPLVPLAVLVELAAWVVLAVAFLGRPRRPRDGGRSRRCPLPPRHWR